MRRLTLVSGAIWLLTMPLVMARFHIFNPIAVLLEYARLAADGRAPWSAGWPCCCAACSPARWRPSVHALCNWQLATVEWLVRFGERVPYGHAWVPGPAEWWLIGFYAALGHFAGISAAAPAAPLALGLAGRPGRRPGSSCPGGWPTAAACGARSSASAMARRSCWNCPTAARCSTTPAAWRRRRPAAAACPAISGRGG